MKRVTLLSTTVSLALFLTLNGCGGGGNSVSADGVNISGKAIDPYLSGSKICLDINDNGTCEVNEPSTHTNENGDYTLNIAKEHHEESHALIVSGGTDIGTDKPFAGTLTAVKEAHTTAHNVTPLTTAVEARYNYCQTHNNQCNETVAEIESNLAEYLGLTKEDINGDIVALANRGYEEPLKIALAMHNAAVKHNLHNPYAGYEEVAKHGFPAGHHWRDDVKRYFPKSYGLAIAIMDIDHGTLENAGITVGEDAATAGVEAGNDAANTGVSRGETAADTHTTASAIALYAQGLSHQSENDAGRSGVKAGNSAAETGTQAGSDAANTGVQTGNNSANTGAKTGNDAANSGAQTGNSAANTGAKAGDDAGKSGVKARNDATKTGFRW